MKYILYSSQFDNFTKELPKLLTDISLTAGQPSAVPGQGEVAGGHRLLDDLLHGLRHPAGPQAGAADEDHVHLVVAPHGDGSSLDAVLRHAGHLRVPTEIKGEKTCHLVVSRSLDVVDKDLVDLSNVWSDQPDLSDSHSLESLQCCGERRGFVGVLLHKMGQSVSLLHCCSGLYLSLSQLSEYLRLPNGGGGRGAGVGQNIQP